MIDWGLTGACQRKKILAWLCGFVVAVVILFSTQIIIVAQNAYRKSQIDNKRANLQYKQQEVENIKNTLNQLQNENINTNLKRKNGMYQGIDKQKLITGIYNKMNAMDDLEAWDNLRKNKKDMEYSAFAISSTPVSNLYAQKIFNKYITKYFLLPTQTQRIIMEGNKVIITFNADFEYVAYRILAMIKNLLPGYVVVKSFSVQPVRQEIKTLLYDMKFYKKDIQVDVDNRLNCQIELDWYFLRNTKGYENIAQDNVVIMKGNKEIK